MANQDKLCNKRISRYIIFQYGNLAEDMLINKARPIRDVLQRFNKKDYATAEGPDERDLATLMKFIKDDTLQTLSKHLFAASGAMYSIATHIMTLETLFSHPAEFAKKHRESPEVQGFKQNPSRESMVAYIASQTLTHHKIIPEDEQGANVWDILTQRTPSRETRQSAPFGDVPEQPGEDPDEGDHDYGYDDEGEETLTGASRRRPRRNILNDDNDEEDDEDTFNTPESSAEHALFITQPDPEPYHEPETLSRAQKGKTPVSRKRGKSSTNIWASFGLSTDQGSTSATNAPPAAKKRPTAVRGRGTRGTTRRTNYLFWRSKQTRLMLSGEVFVADQENMQGVALVCKNQLNIDTLREIKISFTLFSNLVIPKW